MKPQQPPGDVRRPFPRSCPSSFDHSRWSWRNQGCYCQDRWSAAMTPENSSALPTIAWTSSEASPQTTSDATANEAGLRDAPGSSRGSSGWSLTEPTDGAVHGAPTDGPARHRG